MNLDLDDDNVVASVGRQLRDKLDRIFAKRRERTKAAEAAYRASGWNEDKGTALVAYPLFERTVTRDPGGWSHEEPRSVHPYNNRNGGTANHPPYPAVTFLHLQELQALLLR